MLDQYLIQFNIRPLYRFKEDNFVILTMDEQFKFFITMMAKTKGVQYIQSSLPLEQTSLAHIHWTQNWKFQLQKYLKSAFGRCDTNSKRNNVNILVERINFELVKRGDKKIKL